jgi:type IV secretion system protein VirD4
MAVVGALLVVWLALIAAPGVPDGLVGIMRAITDGANAPFKIAIVDGTTRTVLVFLAIYAACIAMYLTTRQNKRPGEEHGSAQWGSAAALNKKYAKKPPENNKILTKKLRMSLDTQAIGRNQNTTVIGGAGSGKTLMYVKPNIAQANCSMVILDPKGENLRDMGFLLESKGYRIRVLDLIRMERSHGYNPFMYLPDENDVQRLVTNLFKSTTPKNSNTQDPFWDNAAATLLSALIFYVREMCEPEEQNFASVMEMLRHCEFSADSQNAVDFCFAHLEALKPNHIALNYYTSFRNGPDKTLQQIVQILAIRLEKFNLTGLVELTRRDELDLRSLGEEKTALFALIPNNDTSFNFLVSILYTQLFQQLLASADFDHGGKLPVPVHFLMDEFANVSLPDGFEQIITVIRSREVFVSIILQNLSQLKALYEKHWETIIGNCDELVYLGGNEASTHKYISELLGKETISTNTYGHTKGINGHYSVNDQTQGRELLSPDEVRTLNNRRALVFIRGEKAVVDRKYNMFRHPNVRLTTYGGAPPYIHGTLLLPPIASVAPIDPESIPPEVVVYTLDDFPDDTAQAAS